VDVAFTVRVCGRRRIFETPLAIRLGLTLSVELMRPAHSDTVHFKVLIDLDIDLLPILKCCRAYDRTR